MISLRDFKIGWRLLTKELSYSAIVVLGLSVGFAVCFLLLGLVRHQLSFDNEVPEVDQIYYAKEKWHVEGFYKWSSGTSFQARKAMVESGLPLIASVYSPRTVDVRYGERVQSIELSLVDPDFRKIFGIKALEGDLDAAIKRPDALALTEETAIRLFGNTDVVGKVLLIKGETFTVTALLATPPATTSVPYAALAGLQNKSWTGMFRQSTFDNWGSVSGAVFVKFTGKIEPQLVVTAIEDKLKKSPYYDQVLRPLAPQHKNVRHIIEFKLEKLRDRNLDGDISDTALQNKAMLAGLAAISIVILMLAMTNYLNLALVRTIRRQREIAMRKVLGASSKRLLQQFFSESILVCLLASVVGLLVAWLFLPIFSDMVDLKLNAIFNWTSVVLCLFSSILLGLASGAYPAWSAMRVLPSVALSGRGNTETTSGLRLRRILTVIQFGAAIGLSAIAIAVTWQTLYVTHLDPGFDPKPLIVVAAPEGLESVNGRAFRDAVSRIPNVTQVSVTNSLMRNLRNGTSIAREGMAPINLRWLSVNPGFFASYDIRAKAGRVFDIQTDQIKGNNSIVLNESAVRKLGYGSNEEAIGQFLKEGAESKQVVGVVADIRSEDPRQPSQASLYKLDDWGGVFTIRTEGDKQQLQTAIEALWSRHFPNAMLRMETMEAEFAKQNRADLRIAQLLSAASVITIAIAAFGIYVLAAYSVQRRTREIVLRKLYGANGRDIASLVAREFFVLIAVGAFLSLPLAFYQIEVYMSQFQDRAPIGIWTLVGALGVGIIVALLSTLRHTIGAVRIAPVKVLRD